MRVKRSAQRRRLSLVLTFTAVAVIAAAALFTSQILRSADPSSIPTATQISAMPVILDIHWELQSITIANTTSVVAQPSHYSIELLSSGAASLVPGCSPSDGYWAYIPHGFRLYNMENAAIGCGFEYGGVLPKTPNAAPTSLLNDAFSKLDGDVQAKLVAQSLILSVHGDQYIFGNGGKALSRPFSSAPGASATR